MGCYRGACGVSQLPFFSDSKAKPTPKQSCSLQNHGSPVMFCCGNQFRKEAGQLDTFTWEISARLKIVGRFENMARMDTEQDGRIRSQQAGDVRVKHASRKFKEARKTIKGREVVY